MREDSVTYSRDFTKDPIFISGGEKVKHFVFCGRWFWSFLFWARYSRV